MNRELIKDLRERYPLEYVTLGAINVETVLELEEKGIRLSNSARLILQWFIPCYRGLAIGDSLEMVSAPDNGKDYARFTANRVLARLYCYGVTSATGASQAVRELMAKGMLEGIGLDWRVNPCNRINCYRPTDLAEEFICTDWEKARESD